MDSLFDVPFLPDENYVDFLNTNAEHLDSVHFSILHNRRLDNRIQLELVSSHDQVISQLARL